MSSCPTVRRSVFQTAAWRLKEAGASRARRGGWPRLFYDDEAVFATCMAHRHRAGNPNDTLGRAFLAMLGPIGPCGWSTWAAADAGFGRALLAAGCAAYTMFDGSRNMCAADRQPRRRLPGCRD
jgi:hypothetical protein